MAYKLNPFTSDLDYYDNASDINNLQLITNATVISEIIDEDNWPDGVFTDPGGILLLIEAGQYYIANGIDYKYNGTTLHRWPIDNLG